MSNIDEKELDDEAAALPYTDDSMQFARLLKVIENGKLTEVLEVTDRKPDSDDNAS